MPIYNIVRIAVMVTFQKMKDRLGNEFIKDDDQRLFHLTPIPNRGELFTFFAETSNFDDQKLQKREGKTRTLFPKNPWKRPPLES